MHAIRVRGLGGVEAGRFEPSTRIVSWIIVPASILLAMCVAGAAPGSVDGSGLPADGRVGLAADLIDDGRRRGSVSPRHAQPHTIFTNFDGANLVNGSSPGHSQTDTTHISGCVGAFPAFGDAGAERAAVLQATRTDWEPFAVTITDQRPASGDYTMVMVGRLPRCCGQGGVAPVVCGDDDLNAVAFSCQGAGGPLGAPAVAVTISQEAAHTFGLMHVDDRNDIMNPSVGPTSDSAFLDACYDYSPRRCSEQRVHCPGGQQNGYQELLALFGEGTPEVAPPVVSITSPLDGDRFEPGASFTITADASDDTGVDRVQLFVDDEGFAELVTPPYTWQVTNIPEGSYQLVAVAADAAGNDATSAVVNITVGDAAPDGADGSDTDGDGADTDSGAPGGTDAGEEGCGCGARGDGPTHWAGLILLVLVEPVSRRACRSRSATSPASPWPIRPGFARCSRGRRRRSSSCRSSP